MPCPCGYTVTCLSAIQHVLKNEQDCAYWRWKTLPEISIIIIVGFSFKSEGN